MWISLSFCCQGNTYGSSLARPPLLLFSPFISDCWSIAVLTKGQNAALQPIFSFLVASRFCRAPHGPMSSNIIPGSPTEFHTVPWSWRFGIKTLQSIKKPDPFLEVWPNPNSHPKEQSLLVRVFLPAAERAGQGVMHLFFSLFNKFLIWGNNDHIWVIWLIFGFPDFEFPRFWVSWILRFLDFDFPVFWFSRFWFSQILRFPDFEIPGFWVSQILSFPDFRIPGFWVSWILILQDFEFPRFWLSRS